MTYDIFEFGRTVKSFPAGSLSKSSHIKGAFLFPGSHSISQTHSKHKVIDITLDLARAWHLELISSLLQTHCITKIAYVNYRY